MAMPLFKASDASKLGIYPSLMNYYVNSNIFERIGRGVYRGINAELNVDFQWEDLVLIAKSVPNGLICLTSALAVYQLTDEIPRIFWIAVSHQTTSPKRKGAKFIRMRDLTTGATTIKIGEESVRIFNLERTIIDAFRCLSKEIAIKALKESLRADRPHKLNLNLLQSYARQFKINLDPYILAFTV